MYFSKQTMIFNFETEKTSDKWFKMSKLKCGLYMYRIIVVFQIVILTFQIN